MITSHPKNSRRRCIKAISENTIIAMGVNGFMIRSFLSRKVVSITYLLPVELFTIISGSNGKDHGNLYAEYQTASSVDLGLSSGHLTGGGLYPTTDPARTRTR